MTFSASDIYSLYRPSQCDRRVYLRSHGVAEAEPSEFDKLIAELGERHEQNHLGSLSEVLDLSAGTLEGRIVKTQESLENRVAVIYQGVLETSFPGTEDRIVGIPDFIIKDANTYFVRDCKLARHADEDNHPEILRQLELYGWLLEKTLGKPPSRLEAYLGDESIASFPYGNGDNVLQLLQSVRRLVVMSEEPYSPVGWSKCASCGFRERCWRMAESTQDVALVYEVDQAMAIALKEQGVTTIEQLLAHFDENSLAEVRKRRGARMVRVGEAAKRILLQAEALRSKQERLIAPLQLPSSDNMVMFDLEGLPPQFRELDKVYLWGTQVFGTVPGEFLPALATFGQNGDKEGWLQFLRNAGSIFIDHGDIPFVHYTSYEKTKVSTYIRRYGDIDGIAGRVLRNLFDLFKPVKESLILPESSYSLKVIEKRAGFTRTMTEFGGDWSIAQYIRAVETQDDTLRQQIIADILKYNEEDLKATWAVLQWLRKK